MNLSKTVPGKPPENFRLVSPTELIAHFNIIRTRGFSAPADRDPCQAAGPSAAAHR